MFNDKKFPPSAPLTPQNTINKYSATIFCSCIHRRWQALLMSKERLRCAALCSFLPAAWLLDVSILTTRQMISAWCIDGHKRSH
jgi:hypothetical protein